MVKLRRKAQQYFFALAFSLELVLKVSAYGMREFFLGQDWSWNNFDFVLVAACVLETFVLQVLVESATTEQLSSVSALRLLRLLRVVRLLYTP